MAHYNHHLMGLSAGDQQLQINANFVGMPQQTSSAAQHQQFAATSTNYHTGGFRTEMHPQQIYKHPHNTNQHNRKQQRNQ